jgi:hypothetical protein
MELETFIKPESEEELGRITERSKESVEVDQKSASRNMNNGILELNAMIGDSKDDILICKPGSHFLKKNSVSVSKLNKGGKFNLN